MAKKKGTSDKRYVVDYRGLNAKLIGNIIGVPRIDDLLDTWSKSKWWSTFDLAAAFWSIPMRESDKKFTAFHWEAGGSRKLVHHLCAAPFPHGIIRANTSRSFGTTTFNARCCVAANTAHCAFIS